MLQIQIIEIHIYCVYSPQRSDDILCGDNHITLVCPNDWIQTLYKEINLEKSDKLSSRQTNSE